MKQDAVIEFIIAAEHPPSDVMVVPTGLQGNGLSAHRTSAFLQSQESEDVRSVPEFAAGFVKLSLLEVQFPLGVIRVGRSPDLDMPTDGGLTRCIDANEPFLPVLIGGLGLKKCLLCPRWPDILSVDPGARLVAVAMSGPLPERQVDQVIDASEDILADNVSMVVGPTPDDGIEAINQTNCREIATFGFDNRPHFLQKRLLLLLGWLYQEFAVVLAQSLPQKVEAIVDVSDGRLGWGKTQPAFSQKLLHQGQHPLFQRRLLRCRDDEVVGIPDQVNLESGRKMLM